MGSRHSRSSGIPHQRGLRVCSIHPLDEVRTEWNLPLSRSAQRGMISLARTCHSFASICRRWLRRLSLMRVSSRLLPVRIRVPVHPTFEARPVDPYRLPDFGRPNIPVSDELVRVPLLKPTNALASRYDNHSRSHLLSTVPITPPFL